MGSCGSGFLCAIGLEGLYLKGALSKKSPSARTPVVRSGRKTLYFLGALLAVSACLLFVPLGSYSLWDDEAETALGARGILKTGDTTALLDHNLHARRAGITLRNLHDRLTPPLASYLTALSFSVGQQDAWFARLPFALCGLGTVALMLYFLWEKTPSFGFVLTFGIALLSQVSLFLYFRQDRYYGTSLFLGVAIFYLYLTRWEKPWARFGVGFLAALLFLSHPLICVQVGLILVVDWLVFGRSSVPFEFRWLLEAGLPLVLLVGPSLFVWNPFLTKSSGYLGEVSLADRWTLFYWNLRDLFTAEFMPSALLVLAPVAFLLWRNRWILRAGLALFVLLLVTSLLSYQRVQITDVADVRYLIVAIPIGLALSTLTLGVWVGKYSWGWVLSLVVLGTNLGSGKIFMEGRPASLPLLWWAELASPMEEPYSPVAEWIRKNIPPRSTVWVEPDYMMYPLMFHAPEPVYAWQLEDPKDPQWADLSPIHFKGRERPEYVIVFGPSISNVLPVLQQMNDAHSTYHQIGQINCFWKDLYRPEIFWRSFRTIQSTGQPNENVYLFQRKST